jgi:hypothetical protein
MAPTERLYVALYARGGYAIMPNGEDKYETNQQRLLTMPLIFATDTTGL